MLTLELLEKMLLVAAEELKANTTYLCELDSVAGDGDHGITVGKMAEAMKQRVEAHASEDLNGLLDDLGMTFMNINGGSAGPLWGTIFSGLADAVEPGVTAVEAEGLRKMFAQAKEDFMDISKAKPGDKTMVDALYPALEAGMAATADLQATMQAVAAVAVKGAEATAAMVAKFGRAKNVGELSLGTKDPGAVSISILFSAMAKAL